MYPFRSIEKTETTILSDGPLRPRGERSDLRHRSPSHGTVMPSSVPTSHRNYQIHKTRGTSWVVAEVIRCWPCWMRCSGSSLPALTQAW